MTDAADELKRYIKDRTSGKGEETFIFIKVREVNKDLANLKIKDEGKGIVELRVHSSDKKMPQWYTHAYMINLVNLNLSYKEIKDKHQLQEILLNPKAIGNPDARTLLDKLDKDFGGLAPDGSDKLFWKTEKFKKKKDLMQVRRKAL
jgi:hypothetical protein